MYIKYPRTPHVPWSQPGRGEDIYRSDMQSFHGAYIVVSEKMDGENTTMYSDHIHARSIDSGGHPSRSYVKSIWARVRIDIPTGWRICGENLYARHTVPYDTLPDYFMVYSIWNDSNVCLSWDDTLDWCELLGLHTVPVLWEGCYDERLIKGISIDGITREGLVIRKRESFSFEEFPDSVAKYVGSGFHVPDEHWMYKAIVPNKLGT